MSNDIAKIDNKLPASLTDVFGVDKVAGDLGSGVSVGFSSLSFRSSKFRVKSGKEERMVTKTVDGEEIPVPSYEGVIVKASDHISKTYYADGYTEGGAKPTCFSVDGISPDPMAESPQSARCASCPNNEWGSATNPMTGKPVKACQDSRRVAIVPLDDIPNDKDGGVLLLRIPGASLKDLRAYGSGLMAQGIDYRTVATRLGFDQTASYPKLTFKPIRKLTDDELHQVAAHVKSGQIEMLLEPQTKMVQTVSTPTIAHSPAVSLEFEEDEPPMEAKKSAPKTKPAKQAQPVTVDAVSDDGDADLADLLSDLEG